MFEYFFPQCTMSKGISVVLDKRGSCIDCLVVVGPRPGVADYCDVSLSILIRGGVSRCSTCGTSKCQTRSSRSRIVDSACVRGSDSERSRVPEVTHSSGASLEPGDISRNSSRRVHLAGECHGALSEGTENRPGCKKPTMPNTENRKAVLP